MTPWSAAEEETLRSLWEAERGSFTRISRRMGRSRGSIDGKSRVLGLQRMHNGRDPGELSEFHPAVVGGRTLFPRQVVHEFTGNVLHSGADMRKLGAKVTKGRWRGYPIYALTLEERATCPRDCPIYRGCYGNHSHWAKRYHWGADLQIKLSDELTVLSKRHKRGFVLRLHQLGDFAEVHAVRFWRYALTAFPALNIFGYTAWQASTPIGAVVAALRDEQWERFAVRTSGATSGPRTIVIDDESQRGDAIVCPAQLGKTKSCSTCGLCWHSQRAVAFLRH